MTRTKSKTATLTIRDQRQEAREEAAKVAAEKAKGKSSQAAKVAAELLEEERLKELKKQEAKDAAFVQDLIDQEDKAKAKAAAEEEARRAKAEEAAKSDNKKKVRVQAPSDGDDDDDEESDPEDSDEDEKPVLKRTPRKRKEEESDDDDEVSLTTPPRRSKKSSKKKRLFDTDSEPDSPEVFARNPNKVCTGILNYKKKAHLKIYEAATKALFADTKDRYDMDVIGAVNLLQKINDRCTDLGLRILFIPENKDALKKLIAGHDSVPGVNLCHNHGTLRRELIKSYVRTFVNLPCREAQEDDMLCMMLQNSLTEKAYQTVTRDPSQYMVGGEKSGLLLLKTILEQSAIDSSIDPDVIRKELAHAYLKFKELKYDVRSFHDWVQQKINALRQTGHSSTDVATHLLTAYKTSNDEKLRLYIDRLEDIARESGTYLEEKDLMNKVKMKFDALETSRKLEAISKQEDDIVALKAQIKSLKKGKSGGDSSGGSNSSGSGGGRRGKDNKKKKDGKKEYIPFPKELRKKPEPTDLTKPIVVEGVNYYFCKKHKWCRHKGSECKGIDRNPNGNRTTANDGGSTTQTTTNTGGGDRGGRAIRAVGAVVQE
jgi:hypothetical protein